MANGFPRPSESLGEPLTILRGQVVQTVVDGFTEATVALPTNPANNVGFLVRRVQLQLSLQDFAVPTTATVVQPFVEGAVSTRQSLATIDDAGLDDDGVIAVVIREYNTSLVTATGMMLAVHAFGEDWDFSIGGILTATRNLSLYLDSNLSIGLQNMKMLLTGHIVQLTDEELVAALSTEVGI